jgi:hypothetical protein
VQQGFSPRSSDEVEKCIYAEAFPIGGFAQKRIFAGHFSDQAKLHNQLDESVAAVDVAGNTCIGDFYRGYHYHIPSETTEHYEK